MHALCSVCSLRDDSVITSKPTWKLKHAHSILETFEYFHQISSKSIHIISSYTVSKLGPFLRHSVEWCHFQWPRVTPNLSFKVMVLFSREYLKHCAFYKLVTVLERQAGYRMAPVSMTKWPLPRIDEHILLSNCIHLTSCAIFRWQTILRR